MSVTISIIGSCQSRDIFNSKFIKNWKDHFTIYSYYTMTSMLSVMSNPVPYNYQNLMNSGMKEHQLEHWYFELEKPILKTLSSKKPDILILDFYADARYGARKYAGQYVVNRLFKLKNRDIIDWDRLSTAYTYQKNSKEFLSLWKDAMDRFMAFMKKHLPDTKIVLNTIKGTNVVKKANGETYINPKIEDLDVDKINSLWREMDEYLIQNYDVLPINFEKEYFLDESYLFGLGVALVHFHKEYYTDYFDKLLAITKNNLEQTESTPIRSFDLLDPRSFEFGAEDCYQISGKFQKKEMDGCECFVPLDCRETLGEYRPQMWSKPVEIHGDGKTFYKLRFDIKVDDSSQLDEKMVIFSIRVFKNVKSIKLRESIDAYSLELDRQNIHNGETTHYEFVFCPKGKYIKVAPFLFKYIPGIAYSHIGLEYLKTEMSE